MGGGSVRTFPPELFFPGGGLGVGDLQLAAGDVFAHLDHGLHDLVLPRRHVLRAVPRLLGGERDGRSAQDHRPAHARVVALDLQGGRVQRVLRQLRVDDQAVEEVGVVGGRHAALGGLGRVAVALRRHVELQERLAHVGDLLPLGFEQVAQAHHVDVDPRPTQVRRDVLHSKEKGEGGQTSCGGVSCGAD